MLSSCPADTFAVCIRAGVPACGELWWQGAGRVGPWAVVSLGLPHPGGHVGDGVLRLRGNTLLLEACIPWAERAV